MLEANPAGGEGIKFSILHLVVSWVASLTLIPFMSWSIGSGFVLFFPTIDQALQALGGPAETGLLVGVVLGGGAAGYLTARNLAVGLPKPSKGIYFLMTLGWAISFFVAIGLMLIFSTDLAI